MDKKWHCKFKFAVVDRVKQVGNFTIEGKELTPSSFVPARSRPNDTGYDVRCAQTGGMLIKPGQYFMMPLGIRSLPEEGWWYELKPRSGTFIKKHISALYGTVDFSWQGELMFAGVYLPDSRQLIKDLKVEYGEKIAQIIPVKRVEMLPEEISNEEIDAAYALDTERGANGFNSSGNA